MNYVKSRRAARTEQNVLILSDRGVDENHAPIPALLAVAAVHNHLINKVLRTEIGLILESGEPREVHHFCTLIGYGVTAINPYLALETVRDLQARKRLGDITVEEAEKNYIKSSCRWHHEGYVQNGDFHSSLLPWRTNL